MTTLLPRRRGHRLPKDTVSILPVTDICRHDAVRVPDTGRQIWNLRSHRGVLIPISTNRIGKLSGTLRTIGSLNFGCFERIQGVYRMGRLTSPIIKK